MDTPLEQTPSAVPCGAQQEGKVAALRAMAAPEVWIPRLRRGRARGRDHHLWANHSFAKLGLFSLKRAHAEALVSLHDGATH